jgi:ABC-type multidrug transport system fused ATPase/permease subunit
MNLGLIVAVVGYFFTKSVTLGLLSISLMPFQLIVLWTIGRKVKRVARRIRKRLSWLSGQTQEKLAAATVVKTFTQEEDEIQRFTQDAEGLVDMGMHNARLNGINQVFTNTLNVMAPLLVILVGGWQSLFGDTFRIGMLVKFVMM